MSDVTITALKLQQLNRRCDYSALARPFERARQAVGMTVPAEVAAFAATCCVESQGLTRFVESLNYSVDGLLNTFGRHRISEADARRLGRVDEMRGGKAVTIRPAAQEEIANIVYGGEWGRVNLGNTEPGDGWRFRGRGPGQGTGRAFYEGMTRHTGVDILSQPDRLADPAVGFDVCARWWKERDLARFVDQAPDLLRRRWNGGVNGLADYKAWLIQTRNIFGA